MAAVTFDTLKFVKTLKKAGVPEEQAEAFSIAVRDSHETAELATKADLTEVRHEVADLRKDMHTLGVDLHKDMHALGQSMVIKLGSLVVLAVGALAAVLKLL